MAGSDLIAKASLLVEERSFRLRTLANVLVSINPDSPPEWVALIYRDIVELDDALAAFIASVGQGALPLMRDVERVSGGRS